MKKLWLICAGFLLLTSCTSQSSKQPNDDSVNYDQSKADSLGIPRGNKLSAAMKRAIKWPQHDNSWFFEYKTMPLKGDLAYEEGVVRRDPSSLFKIKGQYYVWYSKSVGPTQGFAGDIENDKVFPWDRCDIWYATSPDGITWKEQGMAVPRGPKGNYDDRSVFTVEIMHWKDKYYLCYQTMGSLYTVRSKDAIGMAWSTSPDGPWIKTAEPVLKPANNGVWKGTEDNRFLVEKKGDFDSQKVHDPCILPYKGKFYMYYKGERMGEEITWGGREIKQGVAIADNPLGPYVKSEYNPISNSGHEICVWPYRGGIASLVTTDGPEKNTVQWAPDGINFEIEASIPGAPHAIGLVRSSDTNEYPLVALKWGLTHTYNSYDYQSIIRFEAYHPTHHAAKGEVGSKGWKGNKEK